MGLPDAHSLTHPAISTGTYIQKVPSRLTCHCPALHPRQMNELAVREDGTNEYDEAVEDFWRDLPAVDERQNGSNNVDGHEPARDIDEEIKVGKKRKPIAKLDAER